MDVAAHSRARRLPMIRRVSRALTTRSLEIRIPLTVSLILAILLAAFGYLGLSAVQDSRQHSLEQQQLLARAAAQHIDHDLRQAIDLLERAAALPAFVSEGSDLATRRQALSSLYQQTDTFQKTLFLVDGEGDVLWSEPAESRVEVGSCLKERPNVGRVLETGRPAISGECALAAQESVACLTVPIKNAQGETTGVIGGTLDLGGPSIGGYISALRLGKTGYAQLVDGSGNILASTEEGALVPRREHSERFMALISERRETVGSCHSCHQAGQATERRGEVLAFTPLSVTSWGVAVGQSEEEAMAPARTLQGRLEALTLISLGATLLLAWVAMRSFTRPLAQLTGAAERIASGDLTTSLNMDRQDEIGRLAKAFEAMRYRLKGSLEEIQDWNRDLESRVEERTEELERSRQQTALLYGELQEKERARTELLERLITAQEEERKRIARELHDETSQALSALVFATETTSRQLASKYDGAGDKLEKMRELAVGTLEGVHRIIFDLRPTLLDDLGLAAALRWYAGSRLDEQGVRVHLEVIGREERLPPSLETAVYRVLQEAITNVARHAGASNLSITLDFTAGELCAEVEDDGRGIDDIPTPGEDGCRGLGLLGMRERMALVGGRLDIHSGKDAGTRVVIRVPTGNGQRGG